MAYLSDFADQAVLLPVAVLVAACLAVAGWQRGCFAWLAAVGGTFAVMLLLKGGLDVMVCLCGSDYLFSPSGHVAAATVVYGGLAILTLRGVLPPVLVGAMPVLVAALVGATRLTLMVHTPGEVLAGAAVGLAGAAVLAAAVGPRHHSPAWPMSAAAVCASFLLHGAHLPAEDLIRLASASLVS